MLKTDNTIRFLKFIVLSNVGLVIFKVFGGILSKSTALIADGSDSLLNVLSSIITYKYYRKARYPPDRDHPYGHLRYEAYASFLIIILMVITFSFIAFSALSKLSRVIEGVSVIGIIFAAVSFILNIVYSNVLKKLSKESQLLMTEARHISVDVLESSVVLIGVSLGALVSGIFDIMATIAVVGIVVYYIVKTLRELKESITDVSPPTDVLRTIERTIASTEGVIEYHSLRARQYFGKVFADVHVVVRRDISVDKAHDIATRIEEKLNDLFGDMLDIVIHIEPEGDENHHY